MFSIMRENPGPDVELMDFAPEQDAPKRAAILAISSSIWIYKPPTSGNLLDILSATSVAGVMG
jgi:hypothetical protein